MKNSLFWYIIYNLFPQNAGEMSEIQPGQIGNIEKVSYLWFTKLLLYLVLLPNKLNAMVAMAHPLLTPDLFIRQCSYYDM